MHFAAPAAERGGRERLSSRLGKLRSDAAGCALIRDLTTDPTKRDTFDRLAQHLNELANEVERATTQRSRRENQN
ncbi:hypothetical protein FFI89_025145 [Bradyrhizobium sp. KBS0727]|nr:hypothetical protein FFI71_025150 [Bradyrhizobium sp. KBS0725]QDW46734.1 hypothetical protein FFI89_025145 [Bradyrhizobium sp. KBS0727]